MKIYEELARIQKELKAPKNLYNKFGNYRYRNAEGILEALKPLLNGLSLIINDEPVMIGNRFYIKATATLYCPGKDAVESVSAVAYAREDETKKGMDGCQITGACSSYARKYALNALLMIDDSKDSDDDSLSPKNPANQEAATTPAAVDVGGTVPPVSFNPINAIQSWCKGLKLSSKDFNGMRNSVVDMRLVPDIPYKSLTPEQTTDLFEAIAKQFPDELRGA